MMTHLIGCAKQKSIRQLTELVVNIETGAKLSETTGMEEELSNSHDEWTMMGEEREEAEKKKQAMCNEQQREH